MDFADDLALLASTFHVIQQKLPKLKEITRQADPRINKEKAKVMKQIKRSSQYRLEKPKRCGNIYLVPS